MRSIDSIKLDYRDWRYPKEGYVIDIEGYLQISLLNIKIKGCTLEIHLFDDHGHSYEKKVIKEDEKDYKFTNDNNYYPNVGVIGINKVLFTAGELTKGCEIVFTLDIWSLAKHC